MKPFSIKQQKQWSRCFPRLLHFALSDAKTRGLSEIFSWNPDGTHFYIADIDTFMNTVAPLYFSNYSAIASFYRQLRLWGFERVGLTRQQSSAWRHTLFLRDNPEFIKFIKRIPVKRGNQPKQVASRKRSPPVATASTTHAVGTSDLWNVPTAALDRKPDKAGSCDVAVCDAFESGKKGITSQKSIPPQVDMNASNQGQKATASINNNQGTGCNVTYIGTIAINSQKVGNVTTEALKRKPDEAGSCDVAECNSTKINKKAINSQKVGNVSTNSLEKKPDEEGSCDVAVCYEQQKQWSRCFPRLLHFALSDAKTRGLSGIFAWNPEGTEFYIADIDTFMNTVAPIYFSNNSAIASFYRQLRLWGFERVGLTRQQSSAWRHTLFLRDNPEFIKFIKRIPVKRGNQPKQVISRKRSPPVATASTTYAVSPRKVGGIPTAALKRKPDKAGRCDFTPMAKRLLAPALDYYKRESNLEQKATMSSNSYQDSGFIVTDIGKNTTNSQKFRKEFDSFRQDIQPDEIHSSAPPPKIIKIDDLKQAHSIYQETMIRTRNNLETFDNINFQKEKEADEFLSRVYGVSREEALSKIKCVMFQM